MKTLAPKGVSRTPRKKEAPSEVLRIRFRLRLDSGKSGPGNYSRGVLIRFRMKQFDWGSMRLLESFGWRPDSTHLAVERRAPTNTVVALYFRMGFGQIRT
ncbi:hypothetical protein AAC387_Pa07g1958 [Persea americana]